MSPFSWQCQNFCWLSLAFIIDWRVGSPKSGMIATSLTTYVAFQRSVSDWRVSEWRFFSSVFFYSSTKVSWPSEMWVKCNAKIYCEIQDLNIIFWQIVLQILFLSGLAFVIGLERTFRFFFQWHKVKGSAAFFGGILVVLFGWPILGMAVEAYGFIVLFSGKPLLLAIKMAIFNEKQVNFKITNGYSIFSRILPSGNQFPTADTSYRDATQPTSHQYRKSTISI